MKRQRVRKWKTNFFYLERECHTSPQSWGMTSHRDLPLRTASRPEHWLPLRIAVCSSTPPSATRWSEDRNAPRWKWHLHCTSPQLPVWETCEHGLKRWCTIQHVPSNVISVSVIHFCTILHAGRDINTFSIIILVLEATDLQKVLLHSGWVFLAVFWGPA